MEEQQTVSPKTRPASDLRTQYTKIMNEVYTTNYPIFLTKRGRRDAVIMNADAFSKYKLKHDAHTNEPLFSDGKSNLPYCHFCGSSQDKVKYLIAGPRAYICNDCVELCVEIIDGADRGDF